MGRFASACTRLSAIGAQPRRILASPLQRALETAQPLCVATGLTAEVRADLTETGLGAWEGFQADDVEASPQYRSWLADPETFPPPGGE